MALPTYDQLMLPLMKLLSERDEAIKISQASEILAQRSGLTEEELNKSLASGNNIFKSRVGWTKTYLVKAGLISQPKHAFCELSAEGRKLDLNSITAITNDFLMRFDGFSEFHLGTNSGSESNNRKDTVRDIDAAKKSETQTPEEIIQNTTMLLISSLKNDLLKLGRVLILLCTK